MRILSGTCMRRGRLARFTMGVLLAALILMFQTGAAAEVSEAALWRVSDQGPVYVEVLWATPLDAGDGTSLDFQVRMTTHSGDLTTLDFPSLLTLVTSDGREVGGFDWTYLARSSHHPQAVASLPAQVDGAAVVGPQTEWIELRLHSVGSVAMRSFRWELDSDLHAALGHDTSQAQAQAGQPEQTPAVQIQGAGDYRILVPNALDGTVTVVDARSFTVEKTLPVGEAASHGIAVHPDGDRFYVADADAGTPRIFDMGTGAEIGRVPVGHRVHGTDISPDGRYVAVTGEDRFDIIQVDHPGDERVVQTLAYPEADPNHIDFAPDGRYLYAVLQGIDKLGVFAYTGDPVEPYRELARVEVGGSPNESRASADGRRVYTANWKGDSVTAVEVGSWRPLATIATAGPSHTGGRRGAGGGQRRGARPRERATSPGAIDPLDVRRREPTMTQGTVGLPCLNGHVEAPRGRE
ncbi:beta-propeller fold lactonase family protein [Limnochorda pilosa]|uniref:YncE family protein n=1 Tax=Limnochorda pilosa TaxID=1555112 RepID=A0A0K2SQ61_LIMPI|nr:YncE family protein [Limnochorda pilosa]BAS29263.1 hypothetical protein LIP_3451 [Limnochorda pilosa]